LKPMDQMYKDVRKYRLQEYSRGGFVQRVWYYKVFSKASGPNDGRTDTVIDNEYSRRNEPSPPFDFIMSAIRDCWHDPLPRARERSQQGHD
jgi:hypothetical protein